ncbi:MAG: hypothetical protein R3C09_24985 [Pirellulaceae bacterium]
MNRNAETRVLGLFRQASCLSHYLQFGCFDLADEAGGVVDEVVGDNFEHGVTEATNVEDVLTLHRMDRLAQLVPPPRLSQSPGSLVTSLVVHGFRTGSSNARANDWFRTSMNLFVKRSLRR